MAEESVYQVDTLEAPVDDYNKALDFLRRPFTPEAVHWKVQASFKDGGAGLVVPYIDARLVIERLNLVCGENWQEGDPRRPELQSFEFLEGGALLCRLTVFEVTHIDVGDGYRGNTKALFSDALKRVAVKFGVGVSLYAFPKTTLQADSAGLLEKRTIRTKNGPKNTAVITPKGYEHIRSVYKMWLEMTGTAFGNPLDHGDAGEAIGDVEGEGAPALELETGHEEESPESKEGREGLQTALKERGRGSQSTPEPEAKK